jgi:acetyltransferase-like isoleucine patch superfamily enzyme
MAEQMSPTLDDSVQDVLGDERAGLARKYAVLATGRTALGGLLLYELLTGLCSAWPGAVGYWLRQKAYRLLFKSLGRRVSIGRNVTFRGCGRITIGKGVFIDDNCVVDARGPAAAVTIGEGVLVGRNTIIRCRGEQLSVGAGSDIGCNCIIATNTRLEIGRDVLIAAYTYVAAGGRHRFDDKTVPIIRQGFDKRGGCRIGDGAWIGAHCTILDGANVGAGAIVGAHSLVNRTLPDMVIAHGAPARVQRER